MQAFAARETQVLVATTVIEVGIDIPNATAIVVEDADRFGLAQLHQLRGRVGRGADQSYCFLFESSEATEGGLRAARGAARSTRAASSSPSSTCACAARGSSRRAPGRSIRSASCPPRDGGQAALPGARRRPLPGCRGPGRPGARGRGRGALRRAARPAGPGLRCGSSRERSAAAVCARRAATPPARPPTAPASRCSRRLGPIDGLAVADPFAGTGALGLEALSRGAASCVFAETARAALECLRANIESLGVAESAAGSCAATAAACCATRRPPAGASAWCCSIRPIHCCRVLRLLLPALGRARRGGGGARSPRVALDGGAGQPGR